MRDDSILRAKARELIQAGDLPSRGLTACGVGQAPGFNAPFVVSL